jgi:hypothetical protein
MGRGEAEVFFFEKKKQKTFGLWRVGPGERTRQNLKSLLLLFFRKEASFLL